MIKVEEYKEGLRVVRGPDWDWGMQDNNVEGLITSKANTGWVTVTWDNCKKANYRIGKNGKYDLALAPSEVAKLNSSDKTSDFVLPKYWYVVITEENAEILTKWRGARNLLKVGQVVGIAIDGSKGHNPLYSTDCFHNFEITFEQFKKYVLKEDTDEFVLPDKWYIKGSDELSDLYSEFTNCSLAHSHMYYYPKDKWNNKAWNYVSRILTDYTEITLEQFKKYVFKPVEQEFKLPKKFYVKATADNIAEVASWYKSIGGKTTVQIGKYHTNEVTTCGTIIGGGYVLTDEQFNKYVLLKKEPEPIKYADVKVGDTVWLHSNTVDTNGHIPDNQEGRVRYCDGTRIFTSNHICSIDRKYVKSVIPEFKLPEVFCVKVTEENKDKVYQWYHKGEDSFQVKVGRYCSNRGFHGSSPGSVYMGKDITNEEFEKYVWDKLEPIPIVDILPDVLTGCGSSLYPGWTEGLKMSINSHIQSMYLSDGDKGLLGSTLYLSGTDSYIGTENEYDKPLIIQRKRETKRKLIITK